jgi:hypothetical protein
MQRDLALSASYRVLPLGAAGLALALAMGCSGSDAGTGGGGGKDDRYHPKANGSPVDEATACDTLHKALEDKQLALGCVMTLRLCPSLVQVESGQQCAQYDQGTVAGCVTYYGQATDCADLSTRSTKCAFAAIQGSAPNGCPGK